MVSLYKDPDGSKVFAAHDQALITETLSQSLREMEGSGTSVSALQQRIRQLECELTSRSVRLLFLMHISRYRVIKYCR